LITHPIFTEMSEYFRESFQIDYAEMSLHDYQKELISAVGVAMHITNAETDSKGKEILEWALIVTSQ